MAEMSERTARCSYFSTCGQERPSSNRANLAFFQDKGPGSRVALESCSVCRYHKQAHTPETMNRPHMVAAMMKMRVSVEHEFMPRGEFPYDEYFCGCRGWE